MIEAIVIIIVGGIVILAAFALHLCWWLWNEHRKRKQLIRRLMED